jgi:hypothetical protein
MVGNRGEAQRNPDHIRSDAQRRLTRFGVEWFGDQFPSIGAALGIGPMDRAGLREAAEIVLAEVQASLLALPRDEPLDALTANRLRQDRYHALLALIEVMPSLQGAKRVQLEATGGAPLAICSGGVCPIRGRSEGTVKSPFVAEPVKFAVKGCNRIFPDATTMAGKMWPNFCPDCNNVRRKPVRDQERALKRRIHTVLRHPTVYLTTGWPPITASFPRNQS